eukprot:2795191-Rhodomonas_salina.6
MSPGPARSHTTSTNASMRRSVNHRTLVGTVGLTGKNGLRTQITRPTRSLSAGLVMTHGSGHVLCDGVTEIAHARMAVLSAWRAVLRNGVRRAVLKEAVLRECMAGGTDSVCRATLYWDNLWWAVPRGRVSGGTERAYGERY